MKTETGLLIIGLSGQLLFFMRFFLQWLISEKRKKSVIPPSFWYFSLAGGIVLLIYAVLRKDLVFILGQSCGVIIYARNLRLIYKDGKQSKLIEQ